MTATVGEALSHRFGPLIPLHDKPLSAMWRAYGDKAVLKVYRGIAPAERRNREAQALGLARGWGLPAPAVRDSGDEDGCCWLLLDAVGTAGSTAPPDDPVGAFVQRTLTLTEALQQRPAPINPGPGWLPSGSSFPTNSHALLAQLSARCAQRPWWHRLSNALTSLNGEPIAYLHGDIKPEHFVDDGSAVHVVDWEAAARGPAVSDTADAAFHLIRDLIYGNRSVLPLDGIGLLPVNGPIAAWRLVLWLDRRRPDDLSLLTTADVNRLIRATSTADVLRRLSRLVTVAREARVPR
ncbi:phosphotransferase [Actinacidiphila epipremni]|uniref:Phosphotransferase n=1 Tax=Actinacidiphila epipremni TaxID=2053013 RepID=A0ABX0ZHE5_9ACTN|nr:phosphotransferase [Actinacidiphila epipremni]NJP43249.1 phosphotransferase [Actinacidiphila epipremni]